MIIAIDGHSSCGKSSFAKEIAAELGFLYIDSGAMYRAVTFFCLEKEFISGGRVDTHKLISALPDIRISFDNRNSSSGDLFLNNVNVEKEIRSMEVSSHVSEVSKIKEVRVRMVQLQKNLSENQSVVMDGRDIGSVVFPDAEIKIFLTASLEVRAERRYLELKQKGDNVNIEDVKLNIATRDKTDQGRENSPLIQAEDAILLDNSEMNMKEQMHWFRNLMKEKIS